jgi:radical SAM protein with 4Fe4S-binding SPASM domain
MSAPVVARLAPSFLPATAVLEMTYRCNHACVFCSCPWYATDNGFDVRPELSVAQWQQLIARLCTLGVTNFAFTGGEPLLKDGLADILHFAAAQQTEFVETVAGELRSWHAPPKLFLLSNGKALTPDTVALCRQHKINLSLSLPGLTTFAEHTCGGMTAQHVLDWFRAAHTAGVTTTVGVTVTNRNLFELYETLATALLAGADTVLLNRFLPGGRGLQHRDLELSRAQIGEMLATADTVLQTANRDGSVGTELPKCVADPARYQRLKVGTRCSAALDFFVVDPSGWVRVCNHSPTRLVHVDQLDGLKRHPYWQRFVRKDYLPAHCSGCAQIGACDGGCREAAHIVGGQPDAPDPVIASSGRARYSARP